ncbi:MAG: competence/damage-inducible protein A, partial [Acetatifactor sp.]|nr:competence/damage-inducible protein A [Acetatifactor sp.]
MTVELICVGTELLLGNIVNTNAAYLAEKCAGLGLSCYYQSVVGDNEQRLKETLQTAVRRSDVVILSGGLGPTEDDLTKEVAASVMGCELVEDAASRGHI